MIIVGSRPAIGVGAPPCTIDIDRVLRAGLDWLYNTVQPDTAIIDPRNTTTAAGHRVINFMPLGWASKASVIVEVAHVAWGLGPGAGPLNPMPPAELDQLATHVTASGTEVDEVRCAPRPLVGTITLTRDAHPTLRAAVARFNAGCPIHRSRRCWRAQHHGGRDCSWYNDGQRGVIWPFTAAAAAEPAHLRDHPTVTSRLGHQIVITPVQPCWL
ncbi:MAG: hypothetical protein ACRDTK_00560 [Mycobacterium sp.]